VARDVEKDASPIVDLMRLGDGHHDGRHPRQQMEMVLKCGSVVRQLSIVVKEFRWCTIISDRPVVLHQTT
jgi:hypothetical protein